MMMPVWVPLRCRWRGICLPFEIGYNVQQHGKGDIMNFEEYREDASDMTTDDLLDDYAFSHISKDPFYIIDGPAIKTTDAELREWLLWCLFYKKPKDEYPLAKQLINR
jgi:hypothetical protein